MRWGHSCGPSPNAPIASLCALRSTSAIVKGARCRASSAAIIEEPRRSTNGSLGSLQPPRPEPRAPEQPKVQSASEIQVHPSARSDVDSKPRRGARHLMQIIDASRFSRSCVSTPTREGGMASPILALFWSGQPERAGEQRWASSRWPIRAASLRALSDLGLSDPKIASYLCVDTAKVTSLRSLYRIAEGKWNGSH
jgi:hypothetical protein